MKEDIIIRYLLNETNNDENINIEHWIKESDINRNMVEQLYFVLEANKKLRIMNSVDVDKALIIFKHKRKLKKKEYYRKKILENIQRIAAILFLPILSFSLYLFFTQEKDVSQIEIVEMRTNSGIISSFNLPDGSEVCLNSNSVIRYPSKFEGKNREVEIEGQAYFKVVKNTKQPFVAKVFDNRVRVKVLGTEFDLLAYKKDNTVQTTLVEGCVELDIEDKKTKTILKPSEKAVYSLLTNQLQVTAVNTDRETDWMHGRLVFKETPMKEVLARLARFYNVEFDVKNNIINTYTFTGTFQGKPLWQVLDYMRISSNIKHTITYVKDEKGTKSIVELRK